MKRLFSLALIATFIAISGQAFGATVSGTVKWSGPAPKLKAIDMSSDKGCTGKYKGLPAPISQALVLGAGNTIGNIVVKITSGLPADKTFPAPTAPVVITQKGCNYSPHVFGVVKGQQIKFLNEDGILHNVHALPKTNRQFNISMPKTMKESPLKTFRKAECEPFRVKCDVHPWMLSYACVMPHPFFAVTKADGKFTIANLPAGSYELEAWHEKAGVKKATIKIAAADTQTVDFTFSK